MTSPKDTNLRWGATKQEWQHFESIAGLQGELLPVVCNPNATIDDSSDISELGKVPSRYIDKGTVVGFPAWTQFHATPVNIDDWAQVPDYGICIQSRAIPAFDVDVDDPALAAELVDNIELTFGNLPKRFRDNSPRRLLAFRLDTNEPFAKRVLQWPSGDKLEILGTGQQFIAIGTHKTGAKLQWEGGLPNDFPTITLEEFEAWFETMKALYPEMTYATTGGRLRKKGENLDVEDPVADFLHAKGLVLGEMGDDRLLIECPNDHEHSKGTPGDGSTVWFPAGTNGYEEGSFKCLHGNKTCLSYRTSDFIAHLESQHGYVHVPPNDFSAIVVNTPATTAAPTLPALQRNRQGRAYASLPNVIDVLNSAAGGYKIAYDAFRDEIVLRSASASDWRPITDEDVTRIREAFERRIGFQPIGKEMMRDAVNAVAKQNTFDTAIEFLGSLGWDGTPRVDTFLTDYFGVPDSPYARAVSRYWWTASAGRVLEPGVKADMVPVLIGLQGCRKSTAVERLQLMPDTFAEVTFASKEDDFARLIRGKTICEIGELRGLHSRDEEHIKSIVSRRFEQWVPKFKEFSTTFPRRNLFVGTTNQTEFLSDDTGNRRWLPVEVGLIDTDGLDLVHDELWAEGAQLFLQQGVAYYDAEKLANEVHQNHLISDPWEATINRWLYSDYNLEGPPITKDYIRMEDVLSFALGIDEARAGTKDQRRAGKVLRKLGFEKRTVRFDSDSSGKCWFPVNVTRRAPLQPVADVLTGNDDPLAA